MVPARLAILGRPPIQARNRAERSRCRTDALVRSLLPTLQRPAPEEDARGEAEGRKSDSERLCRPPPPARCGHRIPRAPCARGPREARGGPQRCRHRARRALRATADRIGPDARSERTTFRPWKICNDSQARITARPAAARPALIQVVCRDSVESPGPARAPPPAPRGPGGPFDLSLSLSCAVGTRRRAAERRSRRRRLAGRAAGPARRLGPPPPPRRAGMVWRRFRGGFTAIRGAI
jgi:hypothetical protein